MNDEQLSSTEDSAALNEPSSEESGSKGSRFYIPPWVAIAFGVVALLLAWIIISRISSPLSDLLLGSDISVPLPDDARLLEEVEDSNYAQHEWLYASELSGCQIAKFYSDEGAVCRFQPFVCDNDFNQNEISTNNFFNVATCTHSETDNVSGSSWQVLISSGYQEERSRFRIYLFE